MAISYDDNHLDVQDNKANELPDFARTHHPGEFARDHRRIETLVLSEIDLFLFCH
ncbi:MAG: hypothetical protein P8Y65_06385 [Campylobacterales bacterium]